MSDYPKVPQQISDPISENLAKLAELFPAAVKDGALDLEALRAELGEFEEIKPGDETYELNWVGKQAAKKEAFKPLLGKTLALKGDGKNTDTTQNLYIEGDNLEALKLLRQNYYGEVTMMYIDPPYNTGKDFVYKDNFTTKSEESEQEEGAVSQDGQRLIKNERTSNRFHARWLDMIYPRLRLAKDLLAEDGVIFISIDDNEDSNLAKVCDEIFSEENQLSKVIVQSNKRGQTYREIAKCHEYLLVYYKSGLGSVKELPKDNESSSLKDEEGPFELWELRNRNPMFGRHNRPNLYYPIFVDPSEPDSHGLCRVNLKKDHKDMVEVYPQNSTGADSCWRWGKDKLLIEGIDAEKPSVFGKKRRDGGWNVYEKARKGTTKAKSLWLDNEVISEQGTKQAGELDLGGILEFPKPLGLIKKCLQIGTSKKSIVLDFFSGSSTTAHAVMELNAEDGGERKFIMVQLPQNCEQDSAAAKAGYKNIAEIGKERIRRAGEKIKEDLQAKHAEWKKLQALESKKGDKLDLEDDTTEETNPYILDPDSLDIGFKSFRIEDTKINWLKKDLRGEDIIAEAGLTTQDALDFVPGYTDTDVVYELMLRQSNIPLTGTITHPIATAKRTYLYADAYLICLEEKITQKLVEALAAIEPTPNKYFFRDSAFGKDIALKDETFRRLKAEIHKHHGDLGTAYTVEFI